MAAVSVTDPRASLVDVNDWVDLVVEATVRHEDAAAYAGVRARWTRRALADLGARLELAAISRAAAAARDRRSTRS